MSDKNEWTVEDEVGAMQVAIGLIVSGSVIYAIVHLMGWLGLVTAWLFCGLSGRSILEITLPEGKDDESMKERRADIGAGTFICFVGGVVSAIIIFFMQVSGVYEEPVEAKPSVA